MEPKSYQITNNVAMFSQVIAYYIILFRPYLFSFTTIFLLKRTPLCI